MGTSASSPTTDVYFPGTCPSLCRHAGPSPANWTHIHSVSDLIKCDEPLLFDLNVQNDNEASDSIENDSLAFSSPDVLEAPGSQETQNGGISPQPLLVSTGCGAKISEIPVTYQVGSSSAESSRKEEDVVSAARHLGLFMDSGAQCGATILFAKSGSAVVGLYSGAEVTKNGAKGFLEAFTAAPGVSISQVCSPANAALTIGAFAAALEDLSTAQGVVRSWANGLCVNGTTDGAAASLEVLVAAMDAANSTANATMAARALPPRALPARANCRAIEVIGGDSCASLASRCQISASDFTKYNPASNLCSTLQPKQHICCSSGRLPDYRPQPQADGTCAAYAVAAGDGCWAIGDSHYLTTSDIESFNKKTWGWAGCSNLQAGQIICLSTGDPPMPAAIQGTTCGPQVPGTQKPASGVDLSTLNPCPLNACCDVWGFCGTTPDFCTPTPADTGAPGTAKPGTNGCISNCGTELVNNGSPPSSFMNVGYFEAFNQARSCLRMDAQQIPPGAYSHVHFAFATVTESWGVDLSGSEDQFSKFVKMTGFRKVLSFGGWAFSTDEGTFRRFREATNDKNRGAFVNNLVNFLHANDLDGLDFDWEYPGAPDINTEPGSPEEGNNYLEFLKLLKSRLPSGKSISIAIPASFWYLRAYPVKEMAGVVDYFIYMTYDLHGQWDVGNKWSIPSCEGGDCLRSHVNRTETLDALVMLTKAGVSSQKIVVGITSYGRSFRMADPSCSGPLCKYTGDRNHSMAYAGDCTGAPGYISNAEINDIIKNKNGYTVIKTGIDAISRSNILMYGVPGAVDWVAYMDGSIKADRIKWIQGLNFGGTSDWAIDLQSLQYDDQDGGGGDGDGDDDADADDLWGHCAPGDNPGTLEGLADKANSLDPNCASFYGVDILYNELLDALALFKVNSQDYDDKFGWYAQWTKDQIQPRLNDYVSIYKGGRGLYHMNCYYSYGGSSEQKSNCMGMPHFWDNDESWTLRLELADENAFFDDLAAQYGIDKSWVTWGNLPDEYRCEDNGDVAPGGNTNRPCRRITHKKQNFPLKVADDKIQVGNPKELIEASMSNVTALQTSILSSYLDVGLHSYSLGGDGGSPIDAVVAYSMPVFQMAEAVSSMKDVKEIGEKARDDAKRDLIFKILTIIFMVIPFVGEAIGPLVGSVASIARIALLIGEAGNAAVTVAEIIADPTSAPFAMLGLLAGAVGAGAGRQAAVQKASTARGLFKDADLAKFPQRFREKDALVQKLIKKACSAS
ncbi:glycoside hydrolase [Thozetella sp. PMI_491]|nr:glycoside hydrolase [Thozetella sp. PMI_491]